MINAERKIIKIEKNVFDVTNDPTYLRLIDTLLKKGELELKGDTYHYTEKHFRLALRRYKSLMWRLFLGI